MQYEKLRYQPNKKSQLLILAGMVAMVFALFKVINVFRFTELETTGLILPTLFLGIEILIGILVMLASFLLAERFKSYDEKGLIVGVLLAIYPLVKIFLYPIQLYKKFNQMIEAGETIKYNPKRWLITIIVALVISSLLYLSGTIINYIKVKQLKEYQKELNQQNAN